MEDIPPELLDSIFVSTRELHGFGSPFPCLLVCKKWSTLARHVLWRHVVLDAETFSRFLTTCSNVGNVLPAVRSITIRISPLTEIHVYHPGHRPPPSTDSSPMDKYIHAERQLNSNLCKLREIMRTSMKEIVSFSLATPGPPIVFPRGYKSKFFIDAGEIDGILQALPLSCVALELETYGFERRVIPNSNEPHLCPSIRKVMPRLRHLRLALGSVCSDLHIESDVVTQCPELQTLCISLSCRKRRIGHINPECRSLISRNQALSSYQPSVAHTLQVAHAQGNFPKAVQMEVSHHQSNEERAFRDMPYDRIPESAWEKTHPFYTMLLIVRDCVHNVTFPLPLQSFTKSSESSIIYDREDNCYISRTGPWSKLVEHVGQIMPWEESLRGTRVPKGLFSDITIDAPTFMTREDWVAN
ncbi:putative F-box domain-containing protein [Seiridium unicorne]|uniref:F-box domain-containing protein n=1 Tax=Seiridium unicorne TaxID=138068 RepID=A0ABR2UVK3_9PEZI